MIRRYSDKDIDEIWNEINRWKKVAKVEFAVIQARYDLGQTQVSVPLGLLERLVINPEEIDRIEATQTGHDVIAFLMHVSPQLPTEMQPLMHVKMTSYDGQDTALMLMLRDTISVLVTRLKALMETVKVRAFEFKEVPMIGRTHMVHAEPITMGVKLANWYDELNRHLLRLERLIHTVSVGKLSGAVGMYDLEPEVEEKALQLLHLRPIVATQIISRDIISEYLSTIAIISGTLFKMSNTFRNLQSTEIREALEPFRKGQRGSSKMPQKKNPIGSEGISSLIRLVTGFLVTGLLNQDTDEERDLRNSANERIIIPDSAHLLAFCLARMDRLISGWVVNTERMQYNLNLTLGLIYAGDVVSVYAQKSQLPREEAYEHVQLIALASWDSGLPFRELIEQDTQIMSFLTTRDLDAAFNLQTKLKHVDHIFHKVFGV